MGQRIKSFSQYFVKFHLRKISPLKKKKRNGISEDHPAEDILWGCSLPQHGGEPRPDTQTLLLGSAMIGSLQQVSSALPSKDGFHIKHSDL